MLFDTAGAVAHLLIMPSLRMATGPSGQFRIPQTFSRGPYNGRLEMSNQDEYSK